MHVGNYVSPDFPDYLIALLKVFIFGAFIVVGAVVLLMKMTKLVDELKEIGSGNAAVAVQWAGLILSTATAVLSLINYKIAPVPDFLWLLLGGTASISALLMLWKIVGWLIPFNEGVIDTLAVGITRASLLFASGLILYGGFSTSATSQLAAIGSIIWFVPQALVVLGGVYWIASRWFDLNRRIRNGNTTAAILASGFAIAVGFVLKSTIGGEYLGFIGSEANFVIRTFLTIVLLLIVLWGFDKWLFTSTTFAEIIEKQELLWAILAWAVLVGMGLGLGGVVV